MTTLEIHLSTDWATGELKIDFDPPDDEYMPMSVGDWPPVRKEIREEIRSEIAPDEEWQSLLHSNRRGQRLDLLIGTVDVTPDGTWELNELRHTSPESVPL